ncbi:hypothetical protein F892_02384 [Acinetobacter vivianii]|uniref:Excisionase n=1 Tax=Acinetobacter vivianii TaxID=1776742 RepID=N9PZK9_9GAMM|nr:MULTISPECIES: hypothetical protein [Acinetobacter]ENX23141.1 hypothetical protein F892_02384 [Acinetobacter vivianii]MCG5256173.1 hypothetical protein [Acinetobacter pittii]GGI60543.1 hypothetical protein GCM10011446_20380 [Acinetobacter vivianii]
MNKHFELVDWVTAEKFCELTGEQISNLKNLRPQWDEGKVWVKVSDRKILYSLKGYNAWVEQAAQVYQKAQEQEAARYRLILNGTVNASGSPSTSPTHQPTSVRRLRLEKIL